MCVLNQAKARGQELTFLKTGIARASEIIHIFFNRLQFSQLCEISVNNLVLQTRKVKALTQDMGSSLQLDENPGLTPGIMFLPLAHCLAST